MKEKLEFAVILFCVGWAIYKCFRTKNDRMIYGTIVFASVFLAEYPFQVPIEFIFSFNGFFGFAVLLYKSLTQKFGDENLVSLKKAPLQSSISSSNIRSSANKVSKFNRELQVLAFLSLIFGVVFLIQGLVFPALTLPIGSSLIMSLAFGLSMCAFLGFSVLLYRVLRNKLDRSLIVFSVIFLMFGVVCLMQGIFLTDKSLSSFTNSKGQSVNYKIKSSKTALSR